LNESTQQEGIAKEKSTNLFLRVDSDAGVEWERFVNFDLAAHITNNIIVNKKNLI
jgi:hypothetical protein